MTKRAIVDIDDTLWDMWTPVRIVLEARHGVEMGLPDAWEYHRQFVTDLQFYHAVKSVHANQMMYEPFRGAYLLFDSLNKTDHEVIVASNRPPQRAQNMAQWLMHYGLEPYSGVYTGEDKHFLIGKGDLVIDDRPDTIIYATSVGARALTLNYAYNQEAIAKTLASGTLGFHSLEAMSGWIRTER